MKKMSLLLLINVQMHGTSFADLWMEMRKEYMQLKTEFCENSSFKKDLFYHPFWEKTTEAIRRFILGPPRSGFLQFPPIASTMVRGMSGGGLAAGQYHELCYLKHCISQKTKESIQKFKEPAIGNLAITCNDFNCSTNSLGQLYYAARILEKVKKPEGINTIVELGAGFGCLAYIFKTMLPNATIVLFDLPELLAIQYLYLSSALPGVRITMHHNVPRSSVEEGIHLIPIFLLPEVDLAADVFVSNFALSEATSDVQQMVTNKDFFDASVSYITGQLNGTQEKFVSHALIHDSMRKTYDSVDCLPFHIFYPGVCEPYELIGLR